MRQQREIVAASCQVIRLVLILLSQSHRVQIKSDRATDRRIRGVTTNETLCDKIFQDKEKVKRHLSGSV